MPPVLGHQTVYNNKSTENVTGVMIVIWFRLRNSIYKKSAFIEKNTNKTHENIDKDIKNDFKEWKIYFR